MGKCRHPTCDRYFYATLLVDYLFYQTSLICFLSYNVSGTVKLVWTNSSRHQVKLDSLPSEVKYGPISI